MEIQSSIESVSIHLILIKCRAEDLFFPAYIIFSATTFFKAKLAGSRAKFKIRKIIYSSVQSRALRGLLFNIRVLLKFKVTDIKSLQPQLTASRSLRI